MDEIQSLGGPLMCVERRLARQWRGVFGISIEPDASASGMGTDYDYLCRHPNEYTFALGLREGAALILGEMPLITGVSRNHLNEVVIWRIYYADDDDDIPALIAELADTSFAKPLQAMEFSFESPNIIIFDSAREGADPGSQSLFFGIVPGRYLITTHSIKPNAGVSLLLHRFHSIGG